MAITVLSITPDPSRTTAVALLTTDKTGPDAVTELQGMEAKHAAIAAAQNELTDPRINGEAKVYAVDADGKMVEDALKQKVAGYRAELPLSKKLV